MLVKGMTIGFLDAEPGFAEEFNRWYDMDHLPENVALPGIVGARRYAATPEDKAFRQSTKMKEFSEGQGTFCTTYLIGAEDLVGSRSAMDPLAHRLMEEGRFS